MLPVELLFSCVLRRWLWHSVRPAASGWWGNVILPVGPMVMSPILLVWSVYSLSTVSWGMSCLWIALRKPSNRSAGQGSVSKKGKSTPRISMYHCQWPPICFLAWIPEEECHKLGSSLTPLRILSENVLHWRRMFLTFLLRLTWWYDDILKLVLEVVLSSESCPFLCFTEMSLRAL